MLSEKKFETLVVHISEKFADIQKHTKDNFNENMSSYFTKLIRIPNHQSHYEQPKPRSRSLDVEALERSGIKMLRVVISSHNYS